jgi:hypothetical protein
MVLVLLVWRAHFGNHCSGRSENRKERAKRRLPCTEMVLIVIHLLHCR